MQVRVKVKTGVRKEFFSVVGETKVEISIRDLPERNNANRRVKALLAEHYEVLPAKIHLIAGHHTPQKTYEIEME